MIGDAFGASPALALGVEEELLLVDAGTFALASGASSIVAGRGPRFKTELFECIVETTTPVCRDAGEALESLRALRRDVAALAAPLGLTIAAAGAHPFGDPLEQEIVAEQRYAEMLEELGEIARGQLVCGLHVHVSMPSAEACVRALEGMLPWLPAVLAASANSPLLAGAEAGARSARAGRLLELPRSGAPPPLPDVAAFEAAVADAGVDYTRLWWDVRPHPRLGTLEVRIADQQTDVRRSAALAALVQALASRAVEEGGEPFDRAEYARRRAAAARGEGDLEALARHVEQAARTLGTWECIGKFLAEPSEADRQLAVAAAEGRVAVAADLVARSVV